MKKTLNLMILSVVFLLLGTTVFAQSVTGTWKTIDDETLKQKSHVEIYMKGGKLYGKILRTFDDDGVTLTNKLCDDCKGNLYNKPVIGMQIINGLSRDGKVWKGRRGILDPGNGKFYKVKIWLKDSNTLIVRGSIGPIGRKQTWHRMK
ncbi:MAG: DUF2147 domain-containing protein [Bacteroidales bacterium]|nr:DUF2147 domain-containing protein [Bacteroidales bacterium]